MPNVGAFIIRIGFGGILCYHYNGKEPQNSIGNYEDLYITPGLLAVLGNAEGSYQVDINAVPFHHYLPQGSKCLSFLSEGCTANPTITTSNTLRSKASTQGWAWEGQRALCTYTVECRVSLLGIAIMD